ncbi:GNAT family N-acetyltransferase [Dermabacter vaginalis]|uniref:GNAT family N-acetyltransferase n=1 Tax=Dermabacter vaginalis TaxID=1630135 RepID=A0ABX6A7Q0_9MICO|nr:GNAT family N-acetyltransferase [Dermabacter vaginalis]QEU12581.1 GNAT family N-acetyltransferase [Dermabacter vaginalis]
MSEQVRIIRVSHNDPRVTALHAEKDAELEPRYRAYYAAHPEYQGRSDETLDPETILTVLLAVHGNTAVGTVMLRALTDRLEVKRLIVGKKYRGRGIATALMQHIERDAAARGATELYLHTGSLQQDAIALYEKTGWHRLPHLFAPYKDDGVSQCYVKHSCHTKAMNINAAPEEHTPEQKAALERLSVAQENLVKSREAYEKAVEGLEAIKAYNEAMKPLMAYYDNGWLADVTTTESIYERPEAAGEDEIWDMHGGQYELMRELLALSSGFFTRVPGEEEQEG